MSVKSKTSRFKCNFKIEYVNEFPWVEKVPENKNNAKCRLCDHSFTLSNMGRQALVSHAQSKKHKNLESIKGSTLPVVAIFRAQSHPGLNVTNIPSKEDAGISDHEKNSSQKQSESTDSSAVQPKSGTEETEYQSLYSSQVTPKTGAKPVQSNKIQSFFNTESVTVAETVWILHSVIRHSSLRNIESSISIMAKMFPDSEIAQKMKLSKAKASYIITYGLRKYFEQELISLINSSDRIVVGFDESLNTVSKKQQMDIVVRFWNKNSNEVCTRYLTSAFLGRTRASDLLHAFEDSIPKSMLNKIIQISMDGPNVNLKFLRDLQDGISSNENDKILVDIGTCGLHVIHNAFKASIKAVQWGIVDVLRALFNLFNNVPARRAEYTVASKVDLFPKSFCGIRWLENAPVAERARQVSPHVLKYIEKVTKVKIEPTCNSYKIVKNALTDKLLDSKLAFFQAFAGEIEPFLSEFQTNDPKVPFLFDSLSTLYINVLKRFVKPGTLTEYEKNVLKIDLKNSQHLLPAEKVQIGYATKDALKQVKDAHGLDVLKFKNDCRTIMKVFIDKISEKSPFKYPLVKGVSCFNPSNALDKNIAEKRLSIVLEKFVSNKIVPAVVAEKMEREFKQITALDSTRDKLKFYKKDETSLDNLWVSIIELHGIENYQNLFTLIKIIMILSHGNAALERGFSVNIECVIENQKEKSLIAQRMIYDAILATNQPLEDFVVTKKLLQHVKNSHSWYQEALAEEKKNREKEEEDKRNQKRVATVMQELQIKKKKLWMML